MDKTTQRTTSLSIRFSSDGFSLYVNDLLNNILLHKDARISNSESLIESFRLFLDEALELNSNTNHTEFNLLSEHYVIAPSGLFNLNELLNLIEFQHNSLPETEYTLQLNEFKEQNFALAFIIDTTVYDLISSKFDSFELKHHLTNTIHEALALQTIIQCVIRKHKIDLILVIDSKLIYCNSYTYSTNEDILYHLLNMQKTLNIETANIPTEILVEHEQQGLEQLLREHITQLKFKTTQK